LAAHAPRAHAAGPLFKVSESKLDFGSVPLGQGTGMTLVFQNVGLATGAAPVAGAVV